MVPGFLAHGGMVLVRRVIVETDLLETYNLGKCDSIYDAIALSLNDDCHGRVAALFEAAKERPAWKHRFEWFVVGFLGRYPLEQNNMPLKRFLTLHGGEFGKKHPAIFKIICSNLVWRLNVEFDNLDSQKLLVDLVGQPSLLTPAAFSCGILYTASDTNRTNFIKYGYKEAIEEGLKEAYLHGGRDLWKVMVRTLPDQFSGEYPSTDKARDIVLKDFKPTKQDREEAWAEENAQNPQTKLRARQLAKSLNELGINCPIVLWLIVAEYVTVPTWLEVG